MFKMFTTQATAVNKAKVISLFFPHKQDFHFSLRSNKSTDGVFLHKLIYFIVKPDFLKRFQETQNSQRYWKHQVSRREAERRIQKSSDLDCERTNFSMPAFFIFFAESYTFVLWEQRHKLELNSSFSLMPPIQDTCKNCPVVNVLNLFWLAKLESDMDILVYLNYRD